MWLYQRVMSPNDADGMANSVDPDQTAAPLGAVWSVSALFAQACLSENLGSLWYIYSTNHLFVPYLLETKWPEHVQMWTLKLPPKTQSNGRISTT